jgi:uncharacterized protein (DUF302 family)
MLCRKKEATTMTTASYGYTRSLGNLTIQQAQQKVTDALKTEGFGILTEIDVQETMKKKLNIDVKPYKILGACNPPLAHRALSAEPLIGLLLPCNVVVFEDQGQMTVSIAKPLEMFKSVDNPALAPLAQEVDEKLRRVLDRI